MEVKLLIRKSSEMNYVAHIQTDRQTLAAGRRAKGHIRFSLNPKLGEMCEK